MDDLRDRFATLDRVPVPDVWSEVERRLDALGRRGADRTLEPARPEWRGGRADGSRRSRTPTHSRRFDRAAGRGRVDRYRARRRRTRRRQRPRPADIGRPTDEPHAARGYAWHPLRPWRRQAPRVAAFAGAGRARFLPDPGNARRSFRTGGSSPTPLAGWRRARRSYRTTDNGRDLDRCPTARSGDEVGNAHSSTQTRPTSPRAARRRRSRPRHDGGDSPGSG